MKIAMTMGVAALATLALSGCSYSDAALGYLEGNVGTAVNQIKRANDAQAAVLSQAPCAIDIGAYYRALNPIQQQAIAALCGGSPEQPITAQDLVRASQIMDAARGLPVVTAQPLAPPPEPTAPVNP